MQSVSFYVWLLSLGRICSRILHVGAYAMTSFLCMAEEYSIAGMCHIVFLHSSVDGPLGCFHLWPWWIMVNNAPMSLGLQALLKSPLSILLYICLGVELFNPLFKNCFAFWETANCLPQQMDRFAFPPVVPEDPSLHTSTTGVIFCYLK